MTGHHVYKSIWSPVIGEVLNCAHNRFNQRDPYAVGVYRDGVLVGHVPRDLTHQFYELLRKGGTINAVITGRRENRRHRGLEVPARYTLTPV